MKTSSIGPCTALRKRSGGAFLQLHFCKSSQTSVDKKGATVEIMTLKTLLTRELLHHDTTVIIYSNINRYILATESIRERRHCEMYFVDYRYNHPHWWKIAWGSNPASQL